MIIEYLVHICGDGLQNGRFEGGFLTTGEVNSLLFPMREEILDAANEVRSIKKVGSSTQFVYSLLEP